MKTLFSRMEEIANPVMQSFKTDLTEHDFSAIQHANADDMFLWAPYTNGTLLLRLQHKGECFDCRKILIGAMDTMDPKQWYLLDVRHGIPLPVEHSKAKELAEAFASLSQRANNSY